MLGPGHRAQEVRELRLQAGPWIECLKSIPPLQVLSGLQATPTASTGAGGYPHAHPRVSLPDKLAPQADLTKPRRNNWTTHPHLPASSSMEPKSCSFQRLRLSSSCTKQRNPLPQPGASISQPNARCRRCSGHQSSNQTRQRKHAGQSIHGSR